MWNWKFVNSPAHLIARSEYNGYDKENESSLFARVSTRTSRKKATIAAQEKLLNMLQKRIVLVKILFLNQQGKQRKLFNQI